MTPSRLQVQITKEAKSAVLAMGQAAFFAKTGLVLRRVRPTGEVKRNSIGEATWEIERPRLLHVEVQDLKGRVLDPSFTVIAEDIPVVLLLSPLPEEVAVRVFIQDGELRAQPSDA